MDFAEQDRKPKQTVAPTYQSVSPKVLEENSMPLGNGVNYSKVPKAIRDSVNFGDLPLALRRNVPTPSSSGSAQIPTLSASQGAPITLGSGVDYSKVPKAIRDSVNFGDLPLALRQEKAQGQSNAAVPQQSQQPEPKTAQSEPMQLASAKLDAGQAQTQPQSGTSSGEVKVAGGQIRLDPGDTKEKPQRTPEEINRLFPEKKFQADVAARAQSLLKANKARLNSEQKQYTQDNNPKSARWQQLWQAETKRREYQTQERAIKEKLNAVSEEFNNPAPPGVYDGKTREQIQQTDYYKKSVNLQKQKENLKAQIEYARQMQVYLTYAYPALAAIQGETGKNPQDIQKVQGRLPEAFNQTRGDIDKLSKTLTDDPSKAWLFDSVVAAQLKDKSISPQQRQRLVQRIEKEHQNAAGGLMLGGLLSGGLFIASFIPALQNIAIPLRIAGGALGGGIAASQLPDLMALDAAAQAGKGGAGRLTSQSPDEARFNLVMGYANLGLAALDVGAGELVIRGLAKTPGAIKAFAKLTRVQSQKVLGTLSKLKPNQVEQFAQATQLQQAGKTAEAQGLLQQMRKPLGEKTYKEVERAWLDASGARYLEVDASLTPKLLRQYEKLANLTEQEIGQIVKNTGIPRKFINRTKEHLFIDEHEIWTFNEKTKQLELRKGNFAPMESVADLWLSA
jgi:Holliday junction resolvase RusA-like endonuclease